MNKEEVFEIIRNIMIDEFEINSESINPEKNLHDELELDSLDMVDFVLALNDRLGKKYEPAFFKEVETIQGLMDLISKS